MGLCDILLLSAAGVLITDESPVEDRFFIVDVASAFGSVGERLGDGEIEGCAEDIGD